MALLFRSIFERLHTVVRCDIILENLRTMIRYDKLIGRIQSMDTATPKEVISYADVNGREPFTEWLYGLRDSEGRRRILIRMQRLKKGIYGDCESVGEGVTELRMFFGPGYRVYLGEHGNKIVVLLGGDKDSQRNDIQRAKDYWKEYRNRKN